MFVGRRMTRNPITVTGEMSVLSARNLLREKNIAQVPVVEGQRLIGIVTDRDIRKNTASPATTLSVHELNYLLSQMKVKEIMTRDVLTVSPGTTIEEAVLRINRKRVNGLPVVEGDRLVGIITTCDLLNVLLEVIGMEGPSSRFEIIIRSGTGEIVKITGIINSLGLSVISMFTCMNREEEGTRCLVLRVNTDDTGELQRKLEAEGYRLTMEYREEG